MTLGAGSTFGYEDWHVELEALQLSAGDRVCCTTGSGDRALHLLMSEGVDVVSVDDNPVADHLLHLKCAAMRELDHDDCVSFLGAAPGDDRDDALGFLLLHMGVESSLYWDQNRERVDQGLLFGNWRAHLEEIASEEERQTLRRLFECETMEEQRFFLERSWDDALWRKLVGRIVAQLQVPLSPYSAIYDRMMRSLERSLARNSPYLRLILLGEMEPSELPPYLKRETSWKIRSQLGNLTSLTANIVDYLRSVPAGSFDAFSLSNVPSCLSNDDFWDLLEAIAHAGREGARFCIRQLLTSRQIPEALRSRLRPDPELARRLEERDRCFVYAFLAGTVAQPDHPR
jgi:S-adenosylmethionine-diacylglycerol 3-amino-3-carboxypropyl transferase